MVRLRLLCAAVCLLVCLRFLYDSYDLYAVVETLSSSALLLGGGGGGSVCFPKLPETCVCAMLSALLDGCVFTRRTRFVLQFFAVSLSRARRAASDSSVFTAFSVLLKGNSRYLRHFSHDQAGRQTQRTNFSRTCVLPNPHVFPNKTTLPRRRKKRLPVLLIGASSQTMCICVLLGASSLTA